MALLNPSFEDAGALPGEAAHWTLSAVTSAEEIAGFGPAPEQACEHFERWFELHVTIDDVVVLAYFDSGLKGYESFDNGWGNHVFLWEMPPAQLVTATFEGFLVEACDAGWSNVPYACQWADVTSAAAVFDGKPHEDFDSQWHSNQLYAWSWTGVTSAIALFRPGAQAVDDFNNGWTPMTTL